MAAGRDHDDPPPVSDDEASLFRREMADVRSLTSDRAAVRPSPPAPRAAFKRADERAVLDELLDDQRDPAELATGDELSFARPGVQYSVLRRLRRGQYSVQAELDLHGLTAAQARREVTGFLGECRERGVRCARIIHGKGLGSTAGGPVLKPRLAAWLRRQDAVLAYATARRTDGGTGAVYVLIRRG